MAGLLYILPSSAVNPSSRYVPVNNAGIFADSNINNVVDTTLNTEVNGVQDGIYLDFNSGRHYIGDGVLNLTMDTTNYEFNFVGPAGSILSTGAGGNSGLHLIINVNGTPYKIGLLNP